jgi:F-type H+-transporting ATPase subunit b
MNFLDNATLWVGVSFIIFIILVIKPVLKNGKTSLENNIKAIKQRLEEAQSLKYEADKVLKELKDNQKNVSLNIDAMKKKAIEDTTEIEKKLNLQLENTIAKREKMFEQRLEQINLKFKKEVSEKIIKSALSVTKKRIERDLSVKKNNSLIEKSIKDIKIKLN